MKIGEWIGSRPVRVATVTADATLEEAVDRLLQEEGTREVFVLDQAGRLVGHLPHRRLAALLLAEYRPRHAPRHLAERVVGGPVRELMHRPHTVAAGDDFAHAVHRLLELGDEELPVVDEDRRIVGVINLTDVLRAFRAGAL